VPHEKGSKTAGACSDRKRSLVRLLEALEAEKIDYIAFESGAAARALHDAGASDEVKGRVRGE
jgi:hypothetical protein